MKLDMLVNIIVSVATAMIVLTIIVLWWYVTCIFVSGKKVEPVPHNKNFTKFAVIIPARDESKVIGRLFDALKKQTYPSKYFDVWVIVEKDNDPTIEIAKKYGYKYFVRDGLNKERQTKGYAIQELINYFKREKYNCDSYLFFDADNLVDPNYIEIMNDLRGTGVKVGLGYRAFTNPNTNWLTAGSSMMFTYMNQVTSRGRTNLFHKATLMGTGYFVDKQIIDDAGGWQFTGMAEDIQLTAYCYYHDVYMRYYPLTKFYDEQSSNYKEAHSQHIRWLMGYFSRRHFLKHFGVKYNYHTKTEKALMRSEFRSGLAPFIIYNIVNSLLFLASLSITLYAAIRGRDNGFIIKTSLLTVYHFMLIYLPFVIASVTLMIRDKKNLGFTKKTCVICALTYFFYFYDFVIAFIQGVFSKKKRTTWVKVEHTGEIK